jgi:hypothetical protein
MRLIEKLPLLAHMLPNEREKMLEIATTQMCVPQYPQYPKHVLSARMLHV